MKKLSIIFPLLITSGCSVFSHSMDTPVIEDKLGKSMWVQKGDESIGMLAITPERRMVLVNLINHRFCAEAPAEVGVDSSKIINAQSSTNTENGAGITAAADNSNLTLNKRAHSVQLYMAHSYYLCQLFMNEAINEEQIVDAQLKALDNILPILTEELSFIYKSSSPTVDQDKSFVEQTKDRLAEKKKK